MLKIWKLKTENGLLGTFILGFSVGLTMSIIEFCAENDIVAMILGPVLYNNVSLAWLKNLLQYVIHWATYSLLFFGLYYLAWYVYSLVWKLWMHREIFIQGDWLTIHDKENTKIGVAEIKQRFFNISVDAVNVKPNFADTKTTTWNYIGAKFYPDDHSDIKLIGTYFAQRTGEPNKQGVHVFRDFGTDTKGNTTKMSGFFGDVIKLTPGRKLDEFDKTGDILLFKMSPAVKAYIGYSSPNRFNAEKLRRIVSEKTLKDEEFIIELKKILVRNKVKQSRREIYDKIYEQFKNKTPDNLINEINITTLCILKSMAQNGDGNLNEEELEIINEITGFRWTMDDIRNCVIVRDKMQLRSRIEQTMDDIRRVSDTANLMVIFRELVRNICDAVMQGDGTVVRSESEYKTEIESWIDEFIYNQV